MPDAIRVARAVATNQLAWVAPALYVRLTGQTGRGEGEAESGGSIADYFRLCLAAYHKRLGAGETFEGKTVLEYGPGDFPGVAMLLLACGARKVYCVDRFPMLNLSGKNLTALEQLRSGLDSDARRNFDSALVDPADAKRGFRPDRLELRVTPNGYAGLDQEADLVISRAVLEHVNDLDGTFFDMVRSMKPGACALHLVDLKSHGLHRHDRLDFLEWPAFLWSLMYSHKGVPNRWRLDRYRQIVQALPVTDVLLDSTSRATAAEVAAVRPRLAMPFRGISEDDLACLGFWLHFRKPLL